MAGLCVASGVGALLADGAPTSLPEFDAFLRVAFAVLLTLAAVQARRSAWAIAASALVIPASHDLAVFGAALAVFAATVLVAVCDYRTRVVGAAIGTGITQVMLRLPRWGPNGFTALVSAFAVTILVVSSVRSLRRRTRRRVLLALGLGGGFVLALTFAFGVSLGLGRSNLQDGIDAAEAGVTAARQGNTALAIKRFDQASRLLRSASRQLDAPYSRAVRIVPVVGQHEDALRTLVTDAASLAATGALAAREANVDALRVRYGTLDPARVAALKHPLQQVSTALAHTAHDLRGVHSPWFIGPMQDGVDRLASSVHRARHDATTATLAVRVAPRLLGTDHPTNYFVMFVQPAEARASGGLMGNFAILTVDHGHFEMTRFGRWSDLNQGSDPQSRKFSGGVLADYIARYGQFSPAQEWRNINMSPDFPTVAEAVRQLYPQSGGTPIDGVLSLDPTGLAALLKLTGPVRVEGLPSPLTAKNAAKFLLEDQYLTFGARAQRIDFLDEAAHTVTDRLLHTTLPGPRRVGKVLGGASRDGHLRVAFFDHDGEALFHRLGVSGELRKAPGDTFGVVTQNASGNKIELFLHRKVRVDTSVDPSNGRTTSTATITLHNTAPTTGLPDVVIGNAVPGLPIGTNRTYLSLYTTLGLSGATLDGSSVPLGQQTENGLAVYSTTVTIPAGRTVTLRVKLEGANRFVGTRDRTGFRLNVWEQDNVHRDSLTVSVHLPSPWRFDGIGTPLAADGNTATYHGSPRHDMVLGARISD